MPKREFEIVTLKSESVPFGNSGLLEVSHTKINGKDMLSFAKFYFDSATKEKKFPKGFAVPIELKDKVIEAIGKATSA